VAKVTRDRLMVELHQQYPAYRFDQNKGYGTAAHRRALAERGVCPLHRLSFSPMCDLVAAAEAARG
jgi:ribonuclease HII